MPRHDPPCPNQVVRVTGKQRLPISAPRQTHTLRLPALLAHSSVLGLQLIDLALLLEIKDDDARRSCGAQPVTVWREHEGVDLVAGGQRIQVFGFVKIPKHGCAVFAARGAEGAVGGDGNGINIAGVPNVVGLDAAGGEFPDLCGIEGQLICSRSQKLSFPKNCFNLVISALVIGCLMA